MTNESDDSTRVNYCPTCNIALATGQTWCPRCRVDSPEEEFCPMDGGELYADVDPRFPEELLIRFARRCETCGRLWSSDLTVLIEPGPGSSQAPRSDEAGPSAQDRVAGA